MSQHIHQELSHLETELLALSTLVEENLLRAVKALETGDLTLAEEVRQADDRIDQAEVNLEEECLKALALYQPMAIDLRLIVAALKMTNDLERIGDEAVSVAKSAIFLAGHEPIRVPSDLHEMALAVWRMFRKSLDALVTMDAPLAREVIQDDAKVDRYNKTIRSDVVKAMQAAPRQAESYLRLMRAVRSLERVGDHATNIAEDAIYMLEGEIVRHRKD